MKPASVSRGIKANAKVVGATTRKMEDTLPCIIENSSRDQFLLEESQD
jgi:hypothetical protein